MDKATTRDQDWIDTKTVADLFGMTPRRVQQLTKEGILPARKKGNSNQYQLVATVRQYVRYLTDKAAGREVTTVKELRAKERRLEAEADLKRSKADIAALQLKELEGTMHRSEDVEAVMTDLVFTIRSMIIALPGRLAVDVANVSTAAEASDLIRSEAYKILEELANYRYDPDVYARRVREREGWSELTDEEED